MATKFADMSGDSNLLQGGSQIKKERQRVPHLDSDKPQILKKRKKIGPVKKLQPKV